MKWTFDDIPDLTGKTIIVTGGNSGVGYATVKALAAKGASVIMASRSLERAKKSKEGILKNTPQGDIHIIRLDLADLCSVLEFTREFKSRFSHLDALINNAGILGMSYQLTQDGFECNMGTNHLGHFALTALLIDTLMKTPDSRIVNISSVIHGQGMIDLDNMDYDGGRSFKGMKAYTNSKLANLYFTFGLQSYLEGLGSESIAVAAHPGITGSNIPRQLIGDFLFTILKPLIKLALQNPSKGALPQIRAAVDPNVKGGEYYGPGGRFGWAGYPAQIEPSENARNAENIRKLWEISEKLTGIKYP